MNTEARHTQYPLVAVIGSGYWGKNLVRNFYQIGNLKLICDKNETLLAQFQEQYPGVETCLALHDMLSRKDIAGVVIATPAETHYAVAKEALLSGKHVFAEKPLVLEARDAEELIAIARERELVLMVGHLLQYHPAFMRLKELAVGGELGRINYIYSNRLNLGKIRREENILWSFAPHDMSMILTLAGEDPESVAATGGNYLHQKIADVTMTHLNFSSGLQAHIFVSWLHPFKEQKLVVVGDRKMAVFDDTRPWPEKLRLYPHQITWEHNIPIASKAEAEGVELTEAEPLRMECLHFLESIVTGTQPRTDGQEALRVLRVLNAAQHSLDDGGCKVALAQSVPKEAEKRLASDVSVHETAVIDHDVAIGAGTKIWHFSHVLPGSRIGERCNIGQNVVIGPDVRIGAGCKIQNNVSVYKGVTLEDEVFCGPSMVFTNIINPRSAIRKMDQVRPTVLKKGTSVGANATIVCGVTLGRYSFVGAGAVVTKDVPDYALVVGNPARQMGWICECGERLNEELYCTICGKRYKKGKRGVENDG